MKRLSLKTRSKYFATLGIIFLCAPGDALFSEAPPAQLKSGPRFLTAGDFVEKHAIEEQAIDSVYAAEMRAAEALYDKLNFPACLKTLEGVLRRKPNARSALMMSGFCYLYTNQLDIAEKTFVSLAKSKPEDAGSFIGLALTYHEMGATKQYELMLDFLKKHFPQEYANGMPWPQ